MIRDLRELTVEFEEFADKLMPHPSESIFFID